MQNCMLKFITLSEKSAKRSRGGGLLFSAALCSEVILRILFHCPHLTISVAKK